MAQLFSFGEMRELASAGERRVIALDLDRGMKEQQPPHLHHPFARRQVRKLFIRLVDIVVGLSKNQVQGMAGE